MRPLLKDGATPHLVATVQGLRILQARHCAQQRPPDSELDPKSTTLASIRCCNHLTGTSHLSKHPSDLKRNGVQEKTPFFGTVFHTLLHGVIRLVAIVSSKTTFPLIEIL